ncbi:MAG: transaldolase [Chloroflexi bacterium]|nr:transaldolase [Chloroflexota bacterium]
MGIYLDSANPDEARRAQELGFVEGVTTNPKLIAQTGRPGLDVLAELTEIVEGHVFYQLTAKTVEARADEAWAAYKIRPDKVLLKVPATTENFAMASRLIPAGIECAMTAVYSPAQAFLAAQVRASFAIPYYNRMKQHTPDALEVIEQIIHAVRGTPTEVLAASFKSVEDVILALHAGIQHITLPLDLILALGEHELSQRDIRDFSQHVTG